MSEAEVIRCAGIDAAMYLKILRMGGCPAAALLLHGRGFAEACLSALCTW